MKLRSGRQINRERLYISSKSLLRDIYVLSDINTLYNHEWFINKVENTTGTLKYIYEYSDEKLASIDHENKWLRNIYLRAVEIIYVVIKTSYSVTADLFMIKTKRALIRLLDAAHQLQLKSGRILWATRTEPRIRKLLGKLLDTENNEAEMLYRTLRHIISDESLAFDYEIYTYSNGEYSAEELWDYYFGINSDNPEYCDTDHFLNQADTCLERPIRYWNLRMLE
jgi:hypothetical protein